MKVIDYNKNLGKENILLSAHKVCKKADFPVEKEDVYEHLFGSDNLILKLLYNENDNLLGFGVFEVYELFLENKIANMLYLSGMVIDPEYQGKNIARKVIKCTYESLKTDLISLRTQNIAMAKSLINAYDDNLFEVPGTNDITSLDYIRKTKPFKDINEDGVIKNCYPTKLYSNLGAIKEKFNIDLHNNDALGVIIEPSNNKQKKLSIFN